MRSFEIQGIEKFNENDCNFGLNCGLLPGDRNFLQTYPYETGIYHYWKNTSGWAKAKTYVKLEYTDETYCDAKNSCLAYYTLSEEAFEYASSAFQIITDADHHCLDLDDPANFWIIGFDDDAHTLTFAGYLNQDPNAEHLALTLPDFPTFFAEEFGMFQ